MGGRRFLCGAFSWAAAGAVAAAALAASCSAGNNGGTPKLFGTGATTGAGSTVGAGSETGSGSVVGAGGEGNNLFGDANLANGGAGLGDHDACASDTHAGERTP